MWLSDHFVPRRLWRSGFAFQRLGHIWKAAGNALESQRGRWGLWPPIILALGIGFYFQLSVEPTMSVLTLIVVTSGILTGIFLVLCSQNVILRLIGWTTIWFVMGWGAAWWRTVTVATPMLNQPISCMWIKGTVTSVAHPASSRRLFQRVVVRVHPVKNKTKARNDACTSIPKDKSSLWSTSPPESFHHSQGFPATSIQLTIRTPCVPLLEGDVISLKANLVPIGESPTGYQARRAAFFQGISASGFAVSSPVVHARSPSVWNVWRHRITRHLMAHMPTPIGAVACGLVTGDTLAIPQDIRKAFSITGLSHLLAISGLHLSLVSGVCFVAIRWFLGHMGPVPLWVNIDKIAGAVSMVVSWMYMMISGQRYPVQRAFWMLAATFMATLVARRRQSMLTLAQCATVLLLWHPDALLNMGFQLSFTAVACLLSLSSYHTTRRVWDSRSRPRRQRLDSDVTHRLLKKGRQWIQPLKKSVVSSTLITLTTWPLMVYHFGQVSWEGVMTNIVAIPAMSLVIVPLGLLSVMTLAWSWGQWVMNAWSFVLQGVIVVVQWMSTWGENLMWGARFLSPTGCTLMMMGVFWMIVWQKNWRWWGAALTLGALCVDYMRPLHIPNILIDADHKCAAFCDPGRSVLWVTSTRRGKHRVQQWSTQWGASTIRLWPQTASECQQLGLPLWRIHENTQDPVWTLRLQPPVPTVHDKVTSHRLIMGMGVVALDIKGALWGPTSKRPWSRPMSTPNPLLPLQENANLDTLFIPKS